MLFKAPEGYFDKISGLMPKTSSEVDSDKSGYVSGSELTSQRLPDETKTAYYLLEAKKQGTLETIDEYLDPIGYKVHISKTNSWLLGTSDDIDVFVIDISLLKLLVQDSQLGKISGKHTYEFVFSGNNELKRHLRDKLSEGIEEMHWAEKI